MPQNYTNLLFSETKSCILFLIAMLVTTGIAFFLGFFKLQEDEKIDIKLSYVLMVFFIYLFVSFVLGPIVAILSKIILHANNTIGSIVWINLLLNIFIFISIFLYGIKKHPQTTTEIIKKKTALSNQISKDISIGILSWLIAFPLVSFISSFLEILVLLIFKVQSLPDQTAIEFIRSAKSHPFYFSLAIIMVVGLAPILEEFIFRGVLQNFFKTFLKRKTAIILNSIIFAFFHYTFSQKLSNIPILTSLFALSCFLGFVYEKQKSLITPIALHATFNAISIINLIFIKG